MRRQRDLPILIVALLSVAAALPVAAGAVADLPHRFNPALDGKPVFATDTTTGSIWAAWTYRARGEFDIAVSKCEIAGAWSEPAFLGRFDGLDQLAPAMVSDASGNLYLAFAVRQNAQVFLSVLPRGDAAWSEPVLVTSPNERGFSPALAILDRVLVVGYRTADGQVMLRGAPLPGSAVGSNGSESGKFTIRGLLPIDKPILPTGIYDNPDGTDPLSIGNPGSGTTSGSGTGSETGTGTGGSNGTTGVGPR